MTIHFKALTCAFKAVHGSAPAYVISLVQVRVPNRTLRSLINPSTLEPPGTGRRAREIFFSTPVPSLERDATENKDFGHQGCFKLKVSSQEAHVLKFLLVEPHVHSLVCSGLLIYFK